MLMPDTLRRRLLVVGSSALLSVLAACGGSDAVNDVVPPAPPAPTVPAFTTQPVSVTVTAPASASFTAAVTGNPVPTLQWQVSTDAGATWTSIAAATAATLTVNPTSVGQSDSRYRAVATSSAGTVTSNAATLTVNAAAAAAAITTQPADRTVTEPATAAFSVVATGTAPLTYQWQRNLGGTWTNLSGATGDSYTTPATSRTADNGAQFRVAVTNSAGSVISNAATLTVNAAAPAAPWTQVGVPALSRALTSVAFAGTSVAVALGADARYIRSTDGGATWTQSTSPIPGNASGSVAFADANVGVIVARVSNGGGVYRTTNAGASWAFVFNPGAVRPNAVAFGSATVGVTAGDNAAILRTTDGGVTWSPASVSAGVIGFTDVAFADASTVVVVGEGVTRRSTDGGQTFSAVATPPGAAFRVAFGSSQNGVVVGSGNQVFWTADGGQNWSAGTGTALSTVAGFQDVTFLDTNTAIAVGQGAGRGVILRSADGGRTWVAVDAGITGVLLNSAVAFASPTVGVVTGDTGSVLRTTTGGL
jgi:photosystem II stability/assembly factor-like uncharacterized protein